MPDLSIHLRPFVEIVAVVIAVPAMAFYGWRGVRHRRRMRAGPPAARDGLPRR